MTTTTTPETPTIDERTKERLADLTKRRAAILPVGSRPLSMPRDESDALDAGALRLDRQLAAIHTATAAIAALGSTEADELWRGQLIIWRAALCDELLAIKSPIRDKVVMGRSLNLTFSIKAIDFGVRAFE